MTLAEMREACQRARQNAVANGLDPDFARVQFTVPRRPVRTNKCRLAGRGTPLVRWVGDIDEHRMLVDAMVDRIERWLDDEAIAYAAEAAIVDDKEQKS